MHEILENFGPGLRVLDLGSGPGSFDVDLDASFDANSVPFIAIRADLDFPSTPASNFAQADAARLPFADRTFDAVISNHSLEHFHDFAGSLAEIGRVLKPTGALYIAVPDASTFCDRFYRWLTRGGGHVNAFTSAEELAATVERATGLPLVNSRILLASLSYLHPANLGATSPRRVLLAGRGGPVLLHLYTYFARLSDRVFGTRFSVYGWALYFGCFPVPIETEVWSNVCIRCGSGTQSHWLRYRNLVHKRLFWRVYHCPACGTSNLFFDDRHYQR